tara:strand:- start:432 stop:680 length:249 start_codon:yes stop_codon:yes gene_type:complete
MTMRQWEIRCKLQQQGKYFVRTVEALYQHEANKIFDAEMPSDKTVNNILLCKKGRYYKPTDATNRALNIISKKKFSRIFLCI